MTRSIAQSSFRPRPWLLSSLTSILLACPAAGPPEDGRTASKTREPAPAKAGDPPPRQQSRVTQPSSPLFVPAAPGQVRDLVREQRKLAEQAGQTLLVYVGAPWCAPCTAFHDAVDAGKLAGRLPPLRLLEFNHDVDKERLREAGFSAPLIPIFAATNADGGPLGKSMHGGIKGPGAVENITTRLDALLAELEP